MSAEPSTKPIVIYVDADACPVKAEVYRVAERHGLDVHVVANSPIAVPRDLFIHRVVVASGPDAADDWIAERAIHGDIVITADVPLAARCVKTGASVIAPYGKPFTEASIGMALATRDLMDQLRSSGEITGGPKPFSPKDRSTFLQELDRSIMRLKRSGFGRA
ncbi:YaiI/YqxD family protein [Lichenihabitans sp. PAMC28606]|uniref:YaiI/YqxD family protein n=1 Tax=Lichenihabitans sp. PAMC28606 TaxID=2880932 RepID=UPI001D0AA9EB|nr:YaiI/YqxD family protein [Lichenihabitans sp. PAMC28606]UDL93163.1 YaiI/YqxD family protein [Lichenihabitans sp. PAMC28606]